MIYRLLGIFANTYISIFMEWGKAKSFPVRAGVKLNPVRSFYKLFFCCELMDLTILCGFPVMTKYLHKYFILSFK